MAKKATWEKRANKVRKEEHIVLGGNTQRKKAGVKKTYRTGTSEGTGAASAENPVKGRKPASGVRREGATSRPAKDGGTSRPPRERSVGRSERDGNASRPPRERSNSRPEREGSAGRPPRAGATSRPSRDAGAGRPRRSDDDKRSGFKARDNDRGPRKSQGGFDKGASKPIFKPKYTITREGDERPQHFKSSGASSQKFREGDRKKSFKKFLDDKPFEGFEQRGKKQDDSIRLNKYLSIAGICSRREADTYIEQGLVSVNGVTVTELGTKVKPSDEVRYAGERVKAETLRYILLNKPKDCITTLSDERGRSTVIGLVKNACKERVYPVGRLDRNTTGLLLLTNDGDMAKKLTHPSHEVRKVYHVILDKNVSIADLKKLESGVELEDGLAKADAALFVGDGSVRTEIGLEIHSGKNRIVRRMFAALGYEVVRLDRAAFAGLSKKGLPRGRWRFLTEKEISYLKML